MRAWVPRSPGQGKQATQRFAVGRALSSVAMACAMLLCGAETWAQSAACLAVPRSVVITAGSGWSISVPTATYAAGEVITITVTGGTGGTYDFSGGGGQTRNGQLQPGSSSITTASAGSSSFFASSSTLPGASGLAAFSCAAGSGGGSSGGNVTGPKGTQAIIFQRLFHSATATTNGTISLEQVLFAIGNNTANTVRGSGRFFVGRESDRPRFGRTGIFVKVPNPCPKCDELRREVQALENKLADLTVKIEIEEKVVTEARESARIADEKSRIANEKSIAATMAYAGAHGALDELAAKVVADDARKEAADASRAARRENSRMVSVSKFLADFRMQRDDTAKELKQTQDALKAAEKASEGAELPRSTWDRSRELQSLTPYRLPRTSVPDDLLAFDERDTRQAPSSFRITTDDLIEMAQAPDGSNALREALAGKWNLWGEGRITGATDAVAATNGLGFVGNVGVDYKFRPWLAAGMSLGVESFETKIGLAGARTGTIGVSAVPYLGIRLDPNLFVSAFAGITGINYDSNPAPGLAARFGATRLFLGGALTGVWHEGPWRFQPSVSLTYGSEAQSGYVDSAGNTVPGQVVQFGRAAAGPEVGYTFKSDDGLWTLEPFVLARVNLDYASDLRVFLNSLQVATRGTGSGSAGGGFAFQTRDGFSARLQGSYDSIGVGGLDIWNAMLRLNWNF